MRFGLLNKQPEYAARSSNGRTKSFGLFDCGSNPRWATKGNSFNGRTTLFQSEDDSSILLFPSRAV